MSSPWVVLKEPVRYDIFVAALLKAQTPDLMKLHAALGLCEEAGELAGCVKKNIIYGKSLGSPMKEDGKPLATHIVEELGDVLFYCQAVMNLYGLDFQEVLQLNALKLQQRYSDLVYSDSQANERADKPSKEGDC